MQNKNREKLKLTKEQARELISGDLEGYSVISDEVCDTSRWSTIYDIIVKRESDGKYFRDNYSVGSTEGQDEGAYDYSDPDFTEVFPVEKVVIVYE